MEPKPTLCLNMIVKNETRIIHRLFDSVVSIIDSYCICDTGSTDNTKELIKDFFKDKKIDGELVEHKWKDFGHNRSKALKAAYNKTDYVFIFDADDEIFGDFKLPTIYDCDKYTLKFGKDFVYFRPLLFNNRKKFCFKGVLHEYLSNIDEVSGEKNITGNYYIESGRTGNRSQNPNKYIDDANILKKAHYDELEKDYNLSCRYAFYCAQSYKDSGPQYMDDAIEWYKKCLGLNMWLQEKYHSCFTLGDLYMSKKDNVNALKYWYKTIEYDSERIEGIVNAVNFLRNDCQHLLVNALYHKFKNYNKESGTGKVNRGVAPPKNSIPNNNVKKGDEKVILKENANRYTCEGKIANFSFLKKPDRKVVDKKYAMSFADYKKSIFIKNGVKE